MAFDQGRKSLDVATGSNAPTLQDTPTATTPPPNLSTSNTSNDAGDGSLRTRLDNVLLSDIGLSTLLTRLKQTINSTKDFAAFLKERAALEEKYAQGVKKLVRHSSDGIRRPESRQGSYAYGYEEVTRVEDRMADNGLSHANSLHAMADELQDLSINADRGRKHWKQTGLNEEKRVQDAEAAMEKARAKYYAAGDQYERAKTGERQAGKFGLKGTKSAAQQEGTLREKVDSLDTEYAARVEAAQTQRQEVHTGFRPRASRALQELIVECDAGLTSQLQKYAMLNERYIFSNGTSITPLKASTDGHSGGAKSLREVVSGIDNHRDFHDYVLSFSNKAGPPPAIRYEKHPTLASPKQQQPSGMMNQPPPMASSPFGTPSRTNTGLADQHNRAPSGQISGVAPYQPTYRDTPGQYNQYPQTGPASQPYNLHAPQLSQVSGLGNGRPNFEPGRSDSLQDVHTRNEYGNTPDKFQSRPSDVLPNNSVNSQVTVLDVPPKADAPTRDTRFGSNNDERGNQGHSSFPSKDRSSLSGQPEDTRQSYREGSHVPEQQPYQSPTRGPFGQNGARHENGGYNKEGGYTSEGVYGGMPNTNAAGAIPPLTSTPSSGPRAQPSQQNLLPLRPVFGVSLDELFRRDEKAVPDIVYQCIQAVDLFGLNTEGIYRTSGSAPNIMQLKARFDHDSSQVEFRSPANFYNDIASVTTLLKHFLRDLPDPLLTAAQYQSLIHAAKVEDEIVRRDSLHAVINTLPDPNYATLRALALHLNRVAQHSAQNRMTPSNLAICFGPTLMGQGGQAGGDIKDAGWQARVIETILNTTYDIFHDDDE